MSIHFFSRYVQRYFELYADKFKLTRHIQFSTCVERISKCEDFEESGRWEVTYRNNDDIPVSIDSYTVISVLDQIRVTRKFSRNFP